LNITAEGWKEASPLQLAVLQLLIMSSHYVDLTAIGTVKAQDMVSNDGVVRAQIPSDQWISEIQRWEAIVWASSQVVISDYAIGPSIRDPGIAEYVIEPTTTADKRLCGSLKMRKAGGFV
jgi:hypothetical protein